MNWAKIIAWVMSGECVLASLLYLKAGDIRHFVYFALAAAINANVIW